MRVAKYGEHLKYIENLEGWLLAIARNCCLDSLRRRRAEASLRQQLGWREPKKAGAPLQEIHALLRRLARDPQLGERDLLLLRLLNENWRTVDIAARMGITPQAVNKRKRRLAGLVNGTEGNEQSGASEPN